MISISDCGFGELSLGICHLSFAVTRSAASTVNCHCRLQAADSSLPAACRTFRERFRHAIACPIHERHSPVNDNISPGEGNAFVWWLGDYHVGLIRASGQDWHCGGLSYPFGLAGRGCPGGP